MPGTIFRLPDDLTLQRGITYTFLPDGRRIRVPAMNRMQVRAESNSHQEGEDDDIMGALQRMLSGKKGKQFKRKRHGRRVGPARGAGGLKAGGPARFDPGGADPVGQGGLRPVQVVEAAVPVEM